MRHLFKSFNRDDDRRARPNASDTAATTATIDATTTSTSTSAGRNSVGGGRETRLAALRAQRHAAASNAGMSAGEKDGESACMSETSGGVGSRDGLAKGAV